MRRRSSIASPRMVRASSRIAEGFMEGNYMAMRLVSLGDLWRPNAAGVCEHRDRLQTRTRGALVDVDRPSNQAGLSGIAERDQPRRKPGRPLPEGMGGRDAEFRPQAGPRPRGRARDDAWRGVPPAHRAAGLLPGRQG